MAKVSTYPYDSATAAALRDKTVGELEVDIVGSWADNSEPLFLTTTARKVSLRGQVLTIPGVWLDQFLISIRQPGITELSFPNLGGMVVDLNMPQAPAMTAIRFPALQYVEHVYVRDNYGVLETLDLSALKVVDDSFIYDGQSIDVLPSIDLPALVWINNNFTVSNSVIATLDISALRMLGNSFTLSELPNLETIDASALEYGHIFISSLPALTTLDLSGLKVTNQINVSAAVLTTVTFGALKQNTGNVGFSGCALSQASVDAILVAHAALNGTGGTTSYDNFTIDLSGGTNASPSATGLAAKATLEGRGNTVTVN